VCCLPCLPWPGLPWPDGVGELEGLGRARADARGDARFDARGEARVDVVPGVAADVVNVRDRLGTVSAGGDDRAGVTLEDARTEDAEAPPGVGVGAFVAGVTGQVTAFVLVRAAWLVGVTEGWVSGERTRVAGMAPAVTVVGDAVRATLAGVSFTLVEAAAVAGTHLALDVPCSAGGCDCRGEGLAPSGPDCAPLDEAPTVAGVSPPPACVPMPSGPALPRVAAPLLSEVLASMSAWRTG
jgi:hypothetical protein